MEDEVIIEVSGKAYTVQYSVDGEELRVYLPDGQPRTTMLRGLKIESAVRPHLIGYLKQYPDCTAMCEPESEMSMVGIATYFKGK